LNGTAITGIFVWAGDWSLDGSTQNVTQCMAVFTTSLDPLKPAANRYDVGYDGCFKRTDYQRMNITNGYLVSYLTGEEGAVVNKLGAGTVPI